MRMPTLPPCWSFLTSSACRSGFRTTRRGGECDVAATVLGAQVIEKHFTLDKSWPGPDQKASLDPTEFKAMVQAVRHVEAALGDGHNT